MNTRELGRTGIRLFPIGLGGMPLSIQGRPDEAQALRVIGASLDAGVAFIDSADVYCLDQTDIGHNERLIAKALKARGRTKSVTVATKGGLKRPNGDWTRDASPAQLRAACEASLKALQSDSITLYQLHAVDPAVALEESVGELKKLQDEGKILHIGLSNVDLGELERAEKIARIESVQNRCSPYDREDYDDGLLAACEERGITFLPYGPVGGHRAHTRLLDEPLLATLAEKYEATPYTIVLAWHLAKSERILPIPGASKIASAEDSPKAALLDLEPEDLEKIDGLNG